MYNIIISGLKIFAFHGVNPSEKENGQKFIIDAIIRVDADLTTLNDNVENTVSYAKIIKVINREMLKKSYDLIEAVAYNIEKAIFYEFQAVKEIEITLKKPQAPIQSEFDFVAVRIKNNRSDFNV